jgi:RHS repeat-associated protein
MYVTGYWTVSAVYARDGSQIYPSVKDPNGNSFTTSNGNVVDTLNRTPVAASTNGNTTTYSVPNSQGTNSTFTVTTETINYSTNFGETNVTEGSGSFTAIQSIQLPDGSSYGFTYDSGTGSGNYGLLKSMTLPAGGTINYTFSTFQDATGNKNRWLNTRSNGTGSWTYAPSVITSCTFNQTTCKQKVTVTRPSNDYVIHTFSLDSYFYGAWDTQDQAYDSGSNLMSTVTTTYDMAHGNTYVVPLTVQTTVPVSGGSISRQTAYGWDSTAFRNDVVLSVKSWGWYSGTNPTYPTPPDKETDTAYTFNYGYHVAVPTQVTSYGKGSQVAQTQYTYDAASQLTGITGVTQHDDAHYGTGFTARGNVTGILRWVSGSSYVGTSTLYYDTTGQVTKVKDPANNSVTYSRSDSNYFSDNGSNPPTSFSPSVITNAYVTSASLPITGALTFGHYFNTGKRTFVRDQNSADTYHHFIDSIDRETHVYLPSVNGNRAWGMYTYTGQNQKDIYRTVTDTAPSTGCTHCVHSMIERDNMWRVQKRVLMTDPDGASEVDVAYDSANRVQTISNAYRSAADPTYGFNQPSYDGLNRPSAVAWPDGNTGQIYYGARVSIPGGLSSQSCSSTTYELGYPSVVVDEAGNKREEWHDGFGRLVEVDEPDPTSGTLSVNTMNTCYAYNGADALTSVVQGSQTRTYVRDGLSRLTSQTLPESGTTTYSYLNNTSGVCAGNPMAACSKTDARGIKITYAYDQLSRLISKSYSDSTPTANYYYDQASYNGLTITNGTGRLTGMSDGAGTTAWSYDAAGHVLQEKKTVGTVTKSVMYGYNLDGSLASLTYPSGHSVSYTYGNAGRPLTATDASANINYVQGVTYAPHGKIASATYLKTTGFNGITRTRGYNNRLQDASIKDTSSAGAIKDLSYSHSSGGLNNGSLITMTDNAATGRTQTYAYDHLNRITGATTQATSGSDCWGQSFTYADRYGNLSQITGTQTGCSVPGLSVSINSAKNQINTGGYQYDSAGNMTNDPTPLVYTWDAENRLKSVAGVSYTYDGRGRRVQKSSGVMEWYGVDGKLLAETDSSGNLVSEFIYFGGRPVARRDASGSVYYYSSDALGSVRAVTNATGGVQLMSEYYPYGGERIITNNMDDRHKLTGKMRDTETGLDHYDYRMLSSTMGRWISVDSGPMMPWNPQSLNRYAYVLGNPINKTDPDGRKVGSSNSRGIIDNYVLAEISGAGGGGNLCGPDAFGSLITFEPIPSSSSSDGPSNAGSDNGPGSSPGNSPDSGSGTNSNSGDGNQPPVDPLNLPSNAFGPSNPLSPAPGDGTPAGVQIAGFQFNYNGPNPDPSVFGPYQNMDVNVYQLQVVDANGAPVQGDFQINEQVQELQPNTVTSPAVAGPPWPGTNGGAFLDNLGFGDPNGFVANSVQQTFTVTYSDGTQIPLSTVIDQLSIYDNGTLIVANPVIIKP